jgi:uncharacterized protein involved in exopolysaccharide biosynthesis
MLAENAPEIIQQQATLAALRKQVELLEVSSRSPGSNDYIARYREYKYQETLLELFARQYESARVDEGREGALIQVVDIASPPEKKSKPKIIIIAVAASLAGFFLGCLIVILRLLVGARIVQRY